MTKTTRKRIRIASNSLIILVLCFGLGWFALFALKHPPNQNLYREALGATAQNIYADTASGNPDESLKVYAVNVFHSTPLEKTIIGGGVYLGNGLIITASHVVGNWPIFQNPRVLIAGRDLPAHVVKEGSVETVDLALLSVDKSRLPVSLRLRRNPICRGPLKVGTGVLVVVPKRLKPSRTISPMEIEPRFRAQFGSLINEPEDSGSGVFDLQRKCLLGIMSRKVEKFGYLAGQGRAAHGSAEFAGYFVPASKIRAFMPAGLRF